MKEFFYKNLAWIYVGIVASITIGAILYGTFARASVLSVQELPYEEVRVFSEGSLAGVETNEVLTDSISKCGDNCIRIYSAPVFSIDSVAGTVRWLDSATMTRAEYLRDFAMPEPIPFVEEAAAWSAVNTTSTNSGDSAMNQNTPTTNYNTAVQDFIASHTGNDNWSIANEWDIPSLGTIVSATMYRWVVGSVGAETWKYNLCETDTAFDPTTVTWNSPWTTPGGDCSYSLSQTSRGAADSWVGMPMTTTSVSAGTHHYVILPSVWSSAAASYDYFASLENGTASHRPYIEITYSVADPTATPEPTASTTSGPITYCPDDMNTVTAALCWIHKDLRDQISMNMFLLACSIIAGGLWLGIKISRNAL